MMSACNSEMVQIYMYREREREIKQKCETRYKKLGVRNKAISKIQCFLIYYC